MYRLCTSGSEALPFSGNNYAGIPGVDLFTNKSNRDFEVAKSFVLTKVDVNGKLLPHLLQRVNGYRVILNSENTPKQQYFVVQPFPTGI